MEFLRDASEQQLAAAVEHNLFELFRAMVRGLSGAECEETRFSCRHHAFPTNPMFKGVWRSRLREDEADRVIDGTIDWFRTREAPYFFWWIGPGSQPSDLGNRLMQHGLLDMAEQQQAFAAGIVQTGQGAPCMALDLARANDSLLAAVPAGFVIEEVRNEADLADFKSVFVESYGIPEFAGQGWVDATRAIGIGQTEWRMFVGRLDGRAVATNILFCGGGVASVYAVASLPQARGRGIGAAITLAPLLEARQQGYHHAVLFSTEMGISVYERIGFRCVPGRINRYLWRAP